MKEYLQDSVLEKRTKVVASVVVEDPAGWSRSAEYRPRVTIKVIYTSLGHVRTPSAMRPQSTQKYTALRRTSVQSKRRDATYTIGLAPARERSGLLNSLITTAPSFPGTSHRQGTYSVHATAYELIKYKPQAADYSLSPMQASSSFAHRYH